MFSPRVRKLALTVHLTLSVGWIGAVVSYLALGIAAKTSGDAETVRAAWIGMDLVGWFAIVPLALVSLLTGIVMALGTKWGLLRYYWVVFSFALTAFATAVLLAHMRTISSVAGAARKADGAALFELGSDLAHPGIGLAVPVILVLNMYKPPGMTRYGQRKQRCLPD